MASSPLRNRRIFLFLSIVSILADFALYCRMGRESFNLLRPFFTTRRRRTRGKKASSSTSLPSIMGLLSTFVLIILSFSLSTSFFLFTVKNQCKVLATCRGRVNLVIDLVTILLTSLTCQPGCRPEVNFTARLIRSLYARKCSGTKLLFHQHIYAQLYSLL